MQYLTLRFSESFVRFNRRLAVGGIITYPLKRRASIKDIVESFGVPHTEVGSIRVGGKPEDFTFVPAAAATVSVQPIQPPFDVTRPSLLRPVALPDNRFIADVNVGKLAQLMRVVGLDTLYGNSFNDAHIAAVAETEGRIVLSKDTGLLKRRQVAFGRYVQADLPDQQLVEVVDFFGLRGSLRAFSRCIRCNTTLLSVKKTDVVHRLEPKTKKYFHRFKICTTCDRIYWRGSHHDHLVRRLVSAGIDNTIF
jgi:uncharacterized protein with PIN domain